YRRERACGLHLRIGGSVWGVRLRLADAEQLPLCRPRDRKLHGPDQTMGGQFGGMPSRGDRLDDVRGQEGERQTPASVLPTIGRVYIGPIRPFVSPRDF